MNSQKVSSTDYTCARCGGTFEKGWSDEEAIEEQQRAWPTVAIEDCAVVCDDCWNACWAAMED